MTTAALSTAAHESYLDPAETDRLIRLAQDVPVEIVTDPDGTERVVHMPTASSEAAMEKLTNAYLPLIHKVARGSSILEFDDALMVALEEFVRAVRRFEPGSALPFVAGLQTVLSRRLGDVGRTSGLISVKENAAARYRQLMDSVDWDLEEAYRICVETNNGFRPETFLAVHHAIGVGSLDIPQGATWEDGIGGGGLLPGGTEAALTDPAPSPEDQTVQAELVAWLLTQVTDRQSEIVRLRYGFCDSATEIARAAAGLRNDSADLVLSDKQVAWVIGSTTPTVQRQRTEALRLMRAALDAADAA